MNDNLFRRVNWLWKHRHTHDVDIDVITNQIQIIRAEVEGQADTVAVGGSGAYIHLATADQSIAVGGEDVNWAELDNLGSFGFQPSFPTTTVEVLRSGYYNLAVPVLEWTSWTLGGTVSIWRNDTKVWPPPHDAGWSTNVQSVWRAGAAHAVWFDAGDTFRLFVDHGSDSSQVLAHAAVSAYLVDRAGTVADIVAGGGAGPIVVATKTSTQSSPSTSVVVELPLGISAGDLLVTCLTGNATSGTFDTPTGWTLVKDVENFGHTGVWAKVADGTEGGSQTFTLSGGVAESTRRTAHITYRITRHFDSLNPTDVITGAAFTDTQDPPTHGASWGIANNLWLTIARTRRTDNSFTAPSNYGGQLDASNGDDDNSVTRMRIATATRVTTASSEDPDAWGNTGTLDSPNVGTFAVRPVGT